MSTQIRTPAEAARWDCPFGNDSAGCTNTMCAVWRWMPLTVDEPGYKEAVANAIGTYPEGRAKKPLTIQTAPKWVNENRADLGLPIEPYLGYCGAGGKPEA